MGILDSKQLSDQQTPNQKLPSEGPRAIPLNLDFTVATGQPSYQIDLGNQQVQTRFSMLQTLWIDLQSVDEPLFINVQGTGQQIKAKGRTQGYYTVFAPSPTIITISSSSGAIIPCAVILSNTPIAGVVWPTQ